MQRNYVNVAQFLASEFPELQIGRNIHGANYPPPPYAEYIAKALSLIQLFGIGWMILGGDKLLRMLGFGKNGQPLPHFYNVVQENSVPVAVFVFLILPQFLAKFTVTGAFEIYLDGEAVFSKIKTGRFPSAQELIPIFVEAGLKHK